MSSTVSFKVPSKVREKMKRLSSKIRWAEELRAYVSKRVTEAEREEMIRRVDELLQIVRPAVKDTSLKLVREDRESHRYFSHLGLHLSRGRVGGS